MHRAVAGRCVADAGGHVVELRAGLGHDFDPGANAVAIALSSLQPNIEPVSRTLGTIHPELGVLAERGYNHVNFAVAIEVGEAAATVPGRRRRGQPRFLGQRLPFSAGAEIAKDSVALLDAGAGFLQRLNVTAGYKQIFPAVVVQVVEAGTVTSHGPAELAHSAGNGDF